MWIYLEATDRRVFLFFGVSLMEAEPSLFPPARFRKRLWIVGEMVVFAIWLGVPGLTGGSRTLASPGDRPNSSPADTSPVFAPDWLDRSEPEPGGEGSFSGGSVFPGIELAGPAPEAASPLLSGREISGPGGIKGALAGGVGQMGQSFPASYPLSPDRFSLAEGLPNASPDLAHRLADLEQAVQQLQLEKQSARKKADQSMSINVRGLFLFDGAVFSQDQVEKSRYDEQNGLTSRVARLIVEGTGADVMSYKVEFEFARLFVEDLWLGIKDLPVLGNVRIGHMKEPFSLEQLPSPRYNTFMERSVAEAIHMPPRRVGIMAFDTTAQERITWAIGLFSDAPGVTFVRDDHFGGAVTMRLTWLPWYDEATEGRGLLHTGIAYSHRECFRDTVRFRNRPESFLASYAVDTGDIPADSADLLGTELAWVYGPLSAQAEYMAGFVDRIGQSACTVQGGYVMVSYFLTGENRNYLKSQATFGQLKPFENFFRVRTGDGTIQTGKGAWEVKYRYSYLDALDGGKLAGGRIGNHGVGLNWYWNPFTRLSFEYIDSTIDQAQTATPGHLHIFQMRSQIEF